MEAQRAAVESFLNGGSWELLAEFVEVETGKHSDRPQLAAALAACKKHKARLIIAKLDRLARNVHFVSGLIERKVDFVACDRPNAKPFELHIYAAMAEEERRQIAERTRVGLAAAKRRGVKLGGPKLPAINEARQAAAAARTQAIAPVLADLASLSAHAAARELNARGVATPTGAPWSAKTVIRARDRIS